MEESYRVSKKFFEFRPLSSNFSNDQGFTSFGVFAKQSFRWNEILPGLIGFLASISKEEIISWYNNVSIFQHHTGERMMLAGVAFINSSCKPNSMYSYNRQMKIVNLKVISNLGIQDGDEVTVMYGGTFMDPVECTANARIRDILVPK